MLVGEVTAHRTLYRPYRTLPIEITKEHVGFEHEGLLNMELLRSPPISVTVQIERNIGCCEILCNHLGPR
jgi:hypothetical protein